MPTWNHTLKDTAQLLGLKKTGTNSYAGPCPSCGGDDRFHIQHAPTKEYLFGCRVCNDARAIFRQLLLEDIVSIDSPTDVPRQSYRQSDVIHARLMIMMMQNALKSQDPTLLHFSDLSKLECYRDKVDEITAEHIDKTLAAAQALLRDTVRVRA